MKQQGSEALRRYRELLERYHATLDLVSERGLADLDRLLAEASAYAEVIGRVAPEAEVVVDIGSGAGLPGLVLAARLPGCRLVLTERRRKRASFLLLAVGQMGLTNAEVVHGDAAALVGVTADVVVAQAVGELALVWRLARAVLRDPGVIVSRRGPQWRQEAAAVAAESGAAVEVLAAEPLEGRGTLVALRLSGGRACRSSG